MIYHLSSIENDSAVAQLYDSCDFISIIFLIRFPTRLNLFGSEKSCHFEQLIRDFFQNIINTDPYKYRF